MIASHDESSKGITKLFKLCKPISLTMEISATSIFNSAIFGAVALVGAAATVYKLVKDSRYKDFKFVIVKEKDPEYEACFAILRHYGENNSVHYRKATKDRKGTKVNIARDMLCLRDVNDWNFQLRRVRILLFKKGKKKRILLLARHHEYINHFMNMFHHPDLKVDKDFILVSAVHVTAEALHDDIPKL